MGHYQITVEQTGFKKEIRSGINLEVDQRAGSQLSASDRRHVGESVQVSAEAALINTENASIGQVIENKRVQDLPLNGRNAFALVLLAPNVLLQRRPGAERFPADRGTSLERLEHQWRPERRKQHAGGRNGGFKQLLPRSECRSRGRCGSGVQGAIRVDVGRIRVHASGGVINVATKAGTNQYHGTAYEFVRNNIFDARNAFAAKELPFRYNQYGLAFGGPVEIPKVYKGKNRTFFFGNWEQYHYINYSQIITSVPIAAQRNGDFSTLFDATGKLIPIYDTATTQLNPNGAGYIRDQFPGNIIPANRLDPVSQKINQFYPLPNQEG